jgi:predicted phosphate transport protein (TIGR00153 family)
VRATAQQIDAEEGIADEVKEEIRRQLSVSIFSAVERSDTLIALGVQDDVADRANDTGKLFAVRNTVLPTGLQPVFLDFTEAVVRTAEVLLAHSETLQELLEAAHDRARLHGEVERLAEVREGQFRAGQEHQRFLEQLFRSESETDPVTVVILMHIANRLKSVADSAENVAECLERMVAHQ